MQVEEATESEVQLLKVIRNYRDNKEHLVLALKAIADMGVAEHTDPAQVAALCIAIAQSTLDIYAKA